MKMSLAVALVFKKRLIEAIGTVGGNIQTYNSMVVQEKDEVPDRDGVDIDKAMAKRAELKTALINLKLLLWKASEPIRGKILLLAELKDDAVYYGSIPVTYGPVKGYGEEKWAFNTAVIRKVNQTKLINDCKAQIDKIQSEIESYNHVTEIVIPDIELN